MTVTSRVVWIIDKQHWPRAFLRAELTERGYDAVGFEQIEQAVEALDRHGRLRPDVIVLELRDLSAKHDKLEFLSGLGSPVIILGGAKELNRDTLNRFRRATIIKRPFSIGAVADEVEKITDSFNR